VNSKALVPVIGASGSGKSSVVFAGLVPQLKDIGNEEIGCDLLATGFDDITFQVTPDSSCYKIFRTYRIINWCEYDGIAPPVVVSRDWDIWQAPNPGGSCNTRRPDGDDIPGNTDLYVYVKRHLNDNKPDTVWYDADNDPHNEFPDDTTTIDTIESFWWRVVSGGNDIRKEEYYEGNCSSWSFDGNQFDSDISGNIFQDDQDQRYGSFGYWKYTQHIVIYDSAPPTGEIVMEDTFFSTNNNDCQAPVEVSITYSDSCSSGEDRKIRFYLDLDNDGTIDETLSNQLRDFSYTGRYPEGNHRFILEVQDGCGNTSTTEQTFDVVDGLAPSPICYEDIIVELIPNEIDGPFEAATLAQAFIWATDFVASPIYDCNGQDANDRDNNGNLLVTQYSINRAGELPDRDSASVLVNCDDLEGGPVEVEIHAWDELGNHDFCRTNIIVQDNKDACTVPTDQIAIAGSIRMEDNTPLANIEVQIEGSENGIIYTDENGAFAYAMEGPIGNYVVRPMSTEDPLEGLTTFDLILIQKHILGSAAFTSPYQRVAADLDNNGNINILDMLRVKKLLLGIDTEIQNNSPWRFIATDYTFNDADNPTMEDYQESVRLDFDQDTMIINFVAVKIGDVNNSAFDDLAGRSLSKTPLIVKDQMLSPGASYTIPVYVEDIEAFAGGQFQLSFDQSFTKSIALKGGQIQAEDYLINQERGFLRVIWTKALQSRFFEDAPIFYVEIEVNRSISIRQLLQLSKEGFTNEIYRSNGEVLAPQLQFQQADAWNFRFQQNPFWSENSLLFSEPISGQVIFYDQQGRMLQQTDIEGTNVFTFSTSQLTGAGVYIVVVKSEGSTQVKRVILK
ncbi:MAG: T9SS type A sorting domain-containing protein, partial [Bacteroidota bacterium]